MKKTIGATALVLLLAAPCAAADVPIQTVEQRLGAQIGQLVIQVSVMQVQLDQANARIKELETKAPPTGAKP